MLTGHPVYFAFLLKIGIYFINTFMIHKFFLQLFSNNISNFFFVLAFSIN